MFAFFLIHSTFALSPTLSQNVIIVPNPNSAPSGVQSYLEAAVSETAQPGGNIVVIGNEVNSSDGTAFSPGSVNITATIASSGVSVSQVTNASGFNFNITAPSATSSSNNFNPYTIYVTTNDTVPLNKSYSTYISSANNVSILPEESLPPYAPGASFLVNITYFNGSTAVSGGQPLVQVIQQNGGVQSWTISNLSSSTNANGVIQYNITVPSTAEGSYFFLVDGGVATEEFQVNSRFTPVITTQTLSGDLRNTFVPNSAVNLVALIRYSNGTSFNISSTDNITTFITFPNATITSTSLLSQSTGQVNNTFTQTNLVGTYFLRLTATIGGNQYEDSNSFTVNSLRAQIQIPPNSVKEQAVSPNSSISFVLNLYNESDGSQLVGNSTGGTVGSPNAFRCDSTNITFIGYTDTSSQANVTDYTQMTPVIGTQSLQSSSTCFLKVNVPNNPGVYRLDVNITSPDQSENLTASVDVPVQSSVFSSWGIDSGGNPLYNLLSGANATFELSAVNVSNGSTFTGNAIQNITVLQIESSDSVNGLSSAVYDNFSLNNASNCSQCGQNPGPAISFWVSYVTTDGGIVHARVTLQLPSTNGGKIRFQANVAGTTQVTEADYAPQTASDASYGYPLQNGVAAYQLDCSQAGNYTFALSSFDLNTGLALSGVDIQGILSIQDESGNLIGSGPASVVSLPYKNTTNSQGIAVFNLSLSQSIPDGVYVLDLNTSYNGKQSSSPGWVFCKTSTLSATLSASFNPLEVRTDDSFNVTYSNIMGEPAKGSPMQSIQNGTVSIQSLTLLTQDYNWVELDPAAGQTPTANISNGAATLTLSPANFSESSWPNSLSYSLKINVTNGSASGLSDGQSYIIGGLIDGNLDSSAGSFTVVPFNVVIPSTGTGSVPASMNLGTLNWVIVNASTNVSTSSNNITVTFTQPDGQVFPAVIIGTTLMIDAWNSTADKGKYEQWNVSFIVPTALQQGPQLITFTVNNSQGDQIQAFGTTVARTLGVILLTQNDLIMDGLSCSVSGNPSSAGNFTNCLNSNGALYNYTTAQMNMTSLNSSLHVASQSGVVCIKSAFNYTDGITQLPVIVDTTTRMVLVDNKTPGAYDTLVVNTSNGTIAVLALSNYSGDQRRIQGNYSPIYNGLSLANIYSCSRATIVNTSITPQTLSAEPDLGQFPTNGVWYAPFQVSLGSGIAANVTITSFVQKDDSGNVLSTLLPSSYAVTPTQSNSTGSGFVTVNITQNGRYSLLWDVNATVNGAFLSNSAATLLDPSLIGGGVGARVDILSFRACNLNNTANLYSDISSAGTDNLTAPCSVYDFTDSRIANATITVNLKTYATDGSGAVTNTAATLYDGLGNVIANATSSSLQDVTLNFTYPGGWPCNNYVTIESTVTNGSAIQTSALGGALLSC